MSISVGLSLDVSGLQPGEQTARVTQALTEFLIKYDLDRDVSVDTKPDPGCVFAWTEFPIIVTRFGAWSDKLEESWRETLHAIAPDAQFALRWSFEDDDEEY
ncbi:hypothetical protein G6045_08415 [Streptomyces sp. YC504]|uniref:Uncharacterized protein n=1 Tax=Streptomyces mesophilus TaxID=1775132 RepID=A0A6G4XEP0_9ACTN|nr:hypothetical protein [Streptomyces mesophilus]NGO75703.1 hypothetical protein [Streptomyces mesophilus]